MFMQLLIDLLADLFIIKLIIILTMIYIIVLIASKNYFLDSNNINNLQNWALTNKLNILKVFHSSLNTSPRK